MALGPKIPANGSRHAAFRWTGSAALVKFDSFRSFRPFSADSGDDFTGTRDFA